mmetsp:Transcript_151849/g.265291  ORF Transcript_151849/g.265291 Transcript_151849/m.265291 type:complete len:198 (-) Transcript_151849:776-1369(-)
MNIRGVRNVFETSILDRPAKKAEVSLSAFSFLFSELVRLCRNNVATTDEWEDRLAALGYQVGLRTLDLAVTRDRNPKRETNLINMLSFVQTNCWKLLFNKPASRLEKISDDRYTIVDDDMLVCRYISIPDELQGFSCGAFVAGIVKGILDQAQFPARVTAHATPQVAEGLPNQTRILVEFEDHVVAREQRLGDGRKK